MSPSKASRRASRGKRCVIPNRKGDSLWKEGQQDHLARRPPATLEQRRQVRYLARHYPDLKTHRIAKAANCSYSAVPKILANTFGGGDTDLDALPRDKEFLYKYGVQDEDELEVTIPVRRRGGPGNERPVHEDTPGVAAEDDQRNLTPPGPHLPSSPQQCDLTERDELEWVTGFFNTEDPGSLKLPTPVIREIVAAGFKQYTVIHLMRTYKNQVELSNYLATTLRITHVERDVIAGIMMEKRTRFFQVMKREECD